MSEQYIGDLTEATDIDRSTDFIEVERTAGPDSRKITLRNAIGTGWGFYDSTTYTSGSPRVVNNTKLQILMNDAGASTEKGQLPVDSAGDPVELFDTSTSAITPVQIGDGMDLRIDFLASTSSPSAYMTITIDIGSGSVINIVERTLTFPKGTGVTHIFSVGFPIFCLATFVTNGGKIYIDTSVSGSNVSIWDTSILIKRDYAAK